MNPLIIALMSATFGLALIHASGRTVRASKASRTFALLVFGYAAIVALAENITPSLQLFERVLEPVGIVLFGLLALATLWEGYSSIRHLWSTDRTKALSRVSFVASICCVMAVALIIRAHIN